MTIRPRKLLLLLSLLALCGAGVRAGVAHTVTQRAKAFSTPALTATRGDTILFTNDDTVVHNLFANGSAYTLNLVAQPGESSTMVLDKAGDVEVRCAIHPQMVLKVHVE